MHSSSFRNSGISFLALIEPSPIYPPHGGDLHWACHTFGGNEEDWIDLSTGISPFSWPLPELPPNIAERLPQNHSSIEREAKKAFNTDHCVTVCNGTTHVINALPSHLSSKKIAIPKIGFKKHELSWKNANREISHYHSKESLFNLIEKGDIDTVVVINPNNPTGEIFTKEECLRIESELYKHHHENCWLIVDEAFMDATPHLSLVSQKLRSNTIILRSFGKFYGLAGLRLGFIVTPFCSTIRKALTSDPWDINHPAIWWGERALKDTHWHKQQRKRLQAISTENQIIIQSAFRKHDVSATPYFTSICASKNVIWENFIQLAKQKIFTRYIPIDNTSAMLRVGLFTDETVYKVIKSLEL